ncbi:MAG: hypothetical protein GWN93_20830 [Deltaproteobacteria bacterium]|nr:hypothetical protein [Deltaproteobacteria bacterium]
MAIKIPRLDAKKIVQQAGELETALVDARAEINKAKRAGFDVSEQEKRLADMTNKVRMIKVVYSGG